MPDLSSLSDDQLKSLYQGSLSSLSDDQLKSMYSAHLTGPQQQQSPGILGTAADVGKQLGVGIAQGVEAMPTTVPILTGLAGQAVQAGLDKFAPGLTDPQQVQNQAKLRELAAQARGGGISDYLPQAQTGLGEATRYVGNFLPSALGLSGNIPRNVTGAVTGGLGAYGGGQIAPSQEAKPYFETAGALIGGPVGLRGFDVASQKLAARSIPTTADILSDATQRYKAINDRTVPQVIPQERLDNLADALSAKLNMEGPRPSVAPGIHNAIDEIRTPAFERMPDVADIVAARQNIKGFFQNPLPDPNKAGAFKVLPAIDQEIENLSPGTAQALNVADKSYSIGKASEAVSKKLAAAELRAPTANSGMNLGNTIRQRVATYLTSPDSRYLTPEARDALEGVSSGTGTQNAMRWVAQGMGGGNLWPSLIAGGIIGGGAVTGHPEAGLGAAIPIAGLLTKGAYNRSVANNARLADALIRSQAPLAQQMGVNIPSALSRAETAKLSALLSSRAIRGIGEPAGSNTQGQ